MTVPNERRTDTAVVVVDMQNDFCHPDGALYAEGSEAVIPEVNEVIEWARDEGHHIFFTMDSHGEGDPEFEQWGEHCLRDSWGQEIHGDIHATDDDTIIPKSTYDAFYKTPLHVTLDAMGTERLVICGTLANVCVQETASSAGLRGYDVEVVEDAVGYLSDEQREAALAHIDFLVGDVVGLNDL